MGISGLYDAPDILEAEDIYNSLKGGIIQMVEYFHIYENGHRLIAVGLVLSKLLKP